MTNSEASLHLHVDILRSELSRRQCANPRYSMRAFSRCLGLDPGAMSRILRGRQRLSNRTCLRIIRALRLQAPESYSFAASVVEHRKKHALDHLARELTPAALVSQAA